MSSSCAGWLKVWVVFSLSLLLDLSLPARCHGKTPDLLKITFLLWCLAPSHLSGSEVLFDLVVAPLHSLLSSGLDLCRPVCQSAGLLLSQYVLQPTLTALQHLASLLITNIQLIVSATPGELESVSHLHSDFSSSRLSLFPPRDHHLYCRQTLLLGCGVLQLDSRSIPGDSVHHLRHYLPLVLLHLRGGVPLVRQSPVLLPGEPEEPQIDLHSAQANDLQLRPNKVCCN